MCRDGEIGRRKGLKILRASVRAGSSPALGTIFSSIIEERLLESLRIKKNKKRAVKKRLNGSFFIIINNKVFIFRL